ENTIAFDILKLHNDRNCIVILNSEELQLLDLRSLEFEKITDINSIYLQDKPQFVAKKTLVKDLNGDGLDDIILPDFKEVHLLLQQKDSLNKFTLSTLPVNAVVDMNTSQISFSEQKYFIQDINFDGLNDFLFVKDGKLNFFNQKELGQFSEVAQILELPFDFSGLPWWLKRGADGETADQSNLKHSMLEGIQDINGDGILDIMVKKTESSGVLDREISYDFFYGYDKAGTLSFNKEPDTHISAEGTLSNLKLIDMNQDNKMEILVSSFDIGVSQIIGALLSGSIDQDVFIFSLDNKDKYGEEPIFEEEVSLSFSLSSGQSGQPVIMTVDSDGNKQKDIILSVGEKRLNVFHGLEKNEESDEMFNSRFKRHRTKLPADGNMIVASDLNQDGKDELIIRYGKQDDAELKNKIVILTAK
ncbi:MAG: VCBS repeat-containing protein, partial [Kangiellaceae bacterium]